MKSLVKVFSVALVAIATVSCNVEVSLNDQLVSGKSRTITAIAPDTKTVLDGNAVKWVPGDIITVIKEDGNPANSNALVAANINGSSATFTIDGVGDNEGVYAGLYPADNSASYDGDNVHTTFPSTQTAAAGSFGPGANLSIANTVSDKDDMYFKNVCGVLSFTLTSSVASSIASVSITANEDMAGPIKVNASDASFSFKTGDKSKTITLSGSFTSGSTYYIAVLPGTYTGLIITFKKANGDEAVFTNSNSLTVGRNKKINIGSFNPDSRWKPLVDHNIGWSNTGDWASSGSNNSYRLTCNEPGYGYTLYVVKNDGTTPPTIHSTDLDCRVYAKGTVTITNTYPIRSLTFNISTQGKKRLAEITANTGVIATPSVGSSSLVWTGYATSVTFTVGDNADYGTDGNTKAGQLCFNSIDAKYLGVAPAVVNVTGVSLNKASTSIQAGNTEQLIATVTPDNATNSRVTWSSSDNTVATVSNGLVKAVKAGTATITVTTVDGSYTDSCVITVTADPSSTISFTCGSGKDISSNAGATKSNITITATDGTSTANNWGGTTYVRLQAGGTIVVTPSSGVTVEKVVFHCSSSYERTWSASSGDNPVTNTSAHTVTWDGSTTSALTLTNTASSQSRITSIDVKYVPTT